jgi:hypothetical protein
VLGAIKTFPVLPEWRHNLPHTGKHLHQRGPLVRFVQPRLTGPVYYGGRICFPDRVHGVRTIDFGSDEVIL